MGALEGRVAIITGSGRGIGREHALLFAQEGAKVVVNDLGGAIDGSGDDRSPAQQVVDEIKEMGGEAVANADNVADWEGGQRLVNAAVEAFGDLHVLVNNAGILRDRVLVNMTEDEWDAVIHVHLKGHFVPTRWAAAYWREQTKAGQTVKASVINTSSTSGLLGNPGQTNYGAAKSSRPPTTRAGSTSGTRPTSRRWWRGWPPRTAPPPEGSSSCRAARCRASSHGPSPRPSTRTTAGRSRSSRRR
jgi:NAD(P)-dependent dehydrogenase (short-subunit alcohol dehydrogenase family)